MKKRKITVSFEIQDQTDANIVWFAHQRKETWHGMKVLSIRDGSLNEIIQDELDGEREVNLDPSRGY
jgi:hypothetical protein